MTSPKVLEFTVQEPGLRLDLALVEEKVAPSRSAVQKLIEKGLVKVDGQIAKKAGQKVAQGAQISVTIPPPEPQEVAGEELPLDIVYEDEHLLVLNKPRGQVVHPALGHRRGTLVNALLSHTKLSKIGGPLRPGIVHRLDKDTSGLLVVAKTDPVHLALAEMLARQKVLRQYQAIVHGLLRQDRGTIQAPIGRDPANRKRFAVRSGGKPACTHFEVLARYRGYSLLQLTLHTGRTHQIRVHMAYLGHPVVGDPLYGPRKIHFQDLITGQALHAARLGFTHPVTAEELEFTAPLPQDMAAICRLLHREGSTEQWEV
ncbi:MAG: RluA family pseudouridine synthase [Firmicutes bacterium]|jgi:23S rRNA pseudouridine1911/1915/1917 synthase|nr:RluA family pseudouridine synthase [Bacillota bacterium]